MNQKMARRTLPFVVVVCVLASASARSQGQDYEPPDPVFPLPVFHERPTFGAFSRGDGSFIVVQFWEGKEAKRSTKPLDVIIKEYDSLDPKVSGPAEAEFPEALKNLI